MKIINGEDLILGRAASYVAKAALLGEEVAVVNCEKMVVTGSRQGILDKQRMARERGGPERGPFYYRKPEMFVKRVIRRMLPDQGKRGRGKEALKRIKCYGRVPEQFKELETIEKANVKKVPVLKYMGVGEICKVMGAK